MNRDIKAWESAGQNTRTTHLAGNQKGRSKPHQTMLNMSTSKAPSGKSLLPLQSINSSNFNDLVQFDHLKLCKTDSGNTGLLVIIDHFIKFAEAVPCAHDEYDAQTTAKIILNKWFARHGTPARMQSDNATNFNAEIAQELMKASQVTKVTSTPAHPRGNGLVERQNRTLLTLLRVYTSRTCKTGMNTLMESWAHIIPPDTPLQGFHPTCSIIAQKNLSHYHLYTQSSQREALIPKKSSWNTCWPGNEKY